MTKIKGPISAIINLAVWITGILVSLAVGFGMAQKTLTVPWLTNIGAEVVTIIAGWLVVILTLLSILLAIINKIK